MKKSLLFTAFAALAVSASAETKVYWFTPSEVGMEFTPMGQVYAISDNGEFAIVNDDEMTQCYLWKKSDPSKLEYLNWKVNDREVPLDIRGINDAGTIVGSYRPYQSNAWKPYYQEVGGERIDLPVPVTALNTNFPCAISSNGNIIGGYIGHSIPSKTTNDTWGGYWPIIWSRGADGEFEYHINEDMDMPDHQGFPANCMYTDGTLEGTWLGGSLNCGAGATISAVYHNGELTKWNNLEIVELPFMYKGKPHGYYKYEAIDGKLDIHFSDNDYVNAGIYSADRYGHFFGTRFHVGELPYNESIDDENWGKSIGDTYTWGYYDVNTGEWTEVDGSRVVSCALDTKVFFAGTNIYEDGIEGSGTSMASKFGFSTPGSYHGVTKTSQDGSVMGMCYSSMDNVGVEHMYPFIVVLDEGLVGVEDIVVDGESKQLILTYGGTIEVTGAQEVAVYDLNGALVSTKAISNVGSGVYVVVADGKSHKIMVK